MKKYQLALFLSLFSAMGCGSEAPQSMPAAVSSNLMLTLPEALTSLTAGGCVGPIKITYMNGGSSKAVESDFQITQSDSFISFFSDSACSQSLSQLMIPANSSDVSFYLKTTLSVPKFDLNLLSTLGSEKLPTDLAVHAGLTVNGIITGSDSGNFGDCIPYQYKTVDAYGNATSRTNLIHYGGAGGSINFIGTFSDSQCSNQITSVDTIEFSEGSTLYYKAQGSGSFSASLNIEYGSTQFNMMPPGLPPMIITMPLSVSKTISINNSVL